MDKIKCLIVEDEVIAQRIIKNYLSELSDFELVDTCFNALEAMQVLKEKEIDLMFLDIEMPKLKGLDFLKTLKHPPRVIITTAHREYAIEGYELDVLDYLLKPISFDRFIKAVGKYNKSATPSNTNEESNKKFIYVKSERKTLKLDEADILYLEGMSNYIIIHTKDNSHIVYSSIVEILKTLSDQFVRIHRSFVINQSHIKSYNKKIVIIDQKELPIGKTYKEVIQQF